MEYSLDFQFEIVHACLDYITSVFSAVYQINGVSDPIIAVDADGVLTDPNWRKDILPDPSIAGRTGSK
jgi:hypothetical protein